MNIRITRTKYLVNSKEEIKRVYLLAEKENYFY